MLLCACPFILVNIKTSFGVKIPQYLSNIHFFSSQTWKRFCILAPCFCFNFSARCFVLSNNFIRGHQNQMGHSRVEKKAGLFFLFFVCNRRGALKKYSSKRAKCLISSIHVCTLSGTYWQQGDKSLAPRFLFGENVYQDWDDEKENLWKSFL